MAAPLLTDYTTTAEVRAALGVEVKELPDATLALEMYIEGLLTDLRDIGSGVAAMFASVAAIAVDSRTADQAAFYGAVKQFAPYSIAAAALPALPMLAPKSITDGKAGLGRFSDSPYKETGKRVELRLARAAVTLRTAYAALSSDTDVIAVRSYFSAASPDTDVVTDS